MPGFCNKELTIWSFCSLCKASPDLAVQNIMNLILVLTIWWCPRVKLPLLLLEEGVCYDQCVLWTKLLAFLCFVLCVHAQLLQSCLNLCDSMENSLPSSSVHGILQARVLEWIAMSFSRDFILYSNATLHVIPNTLTSYICVPVLYDEKHSHISHGS